MLEYFFQHPRDTVHIRGLSEQLDSPYPTVRKALQSLEDKGLLEGEKKAQMTLYSVPEKSTSFREAKQLYNLEKLKKSGLISFLEEQLRPDAIVLFGSYLDGRDTEESDIDLAVIGGRNREIEVAEFEEELGREVSLTRIDDPTDESTDFRNTLANGLVLQGYLEVV